MLAEMMLTNNTDFTCFVNLAFYSSRAGKLSANLLGWVEACLPVLGC